MRTNLLRSPLLGALVLTLLAPVAIAQTDGPLGLTSMVKSHSEIAHVAMKKLDVQALIAEDLKNQSELRGRTPFRVAEIQPAYYTPQNSGTLEELGDGSKLWRLAITSPDAVFTAFSLSNVRLPAGSVLWAYSPDRDSQVGPYTSRHNNSELVLGTSIVAGDKAVLELYLPAGAEIPALTVEGVSHGYRDFRNISRTPLRDGRVPRKRDLPGMKLGACEVDVVCPEGNGWQTDKQAVAQTFDGRFICTGTLLANARQDCRLLFLTANHCTKNSKTASKLTFFWNYENSSCGGNDANQNSSTSGSTLLGTSSTSDYTLVELNEAPPASFNVYWAGFDRGTAAASAATAIHHPDGAARKISHEFDPVVDGESSGWGNDHWRVTGWDVGTTEGGSSGGGLWNQNHQVVGQLHGGTGSCAGGWDEYGKLDVSWGLGAAAHLDPDGTGAVAVNGHDASACSVTPPPPPPPGGCSPAGASCTAGSECCSGNCKGKSGNKTCK